MPKYFMLTADLPASSVVTPIYICRVDGAEALLATLTPAQQVFASARNFKASKGQLVLLPNADGQTEKVLFGAGRDKGYETSALLAGSLAQKLPEGIYEIAQKPDDWAAPLLATAWGMGAYKFTKYLKQPLGCAVLLLGGEMEPRETMAVVGALSRGRDMINTPAADMGPIAMQAMAQNVADTRGAELKVTIGEDLLSDNYPMIHAVGRAAHEAPRLIELHWGNENAPRLALVGKGVTFDTGGLNMKSAVGMRVMKKDMGGAAHALALADMIMAAGLPVRLHVLLAVAENAVSGNAFRPGDVLSSRKGLTVEIDNTDAEGRLVLGDALTRACEDEPRLVIDFATLTGAARVALGPTLPPFFSNRTGPIGALLDSGTVHADPIWHMPLWAPYLELLSSSIADMKNAGSGFAGAVTAALFLERFISKEQAWMHFDVYGWNPTSAPAKPKGGEIMAVRALYEWLKAGGLSDID